MTSPDNIKLKRLVDKLKELFQLDQPELDFGIYRIMHAKSAEVTQFLEKDLLPQVREAFAQFQSADVVEAKKSLEQMVAQLTNASVDPESSPKVQELRAKVARAVDIASLENEVYDHLYTFFRRYYSEGDFLSNRVYKEGVYAIPYEGEEVKLYWANHDQYYIKTSEYLRDYAFRLRADHGTDPMRVHFKLVDVANDEHGNVKAAEGKERQFILAAENFIAEDAGELSLRFEYRCASVEDWPEAQRAGKTKPPSREALIEIAEQRVLAVNELSLQRWLNELRRTHTTGNGEQAEYSRLIAHLRRYTARHTFDYFIHKDLGGFLRRELDFYIKNEIMRLDDIESELAPKVEQYLSKIKAMRRIAGKIIEFLEQLENFQKKLWLKKKFVVETSYCIRLGCIPQELYAQIAGNEAQREEWVRQCRIDEIKGEAETTGYSRPLTVEFLRAQPTLMLNTRHFDKKFTAKLLAAFDNLDEHIDGVLIHSDNYQALSLAGSRYAKSIGMIFADPPYNTGVDGFPYKDSYQHSSWLSMLKGGLEQARELLTPTALVFLTIDFVEVSRLRLLCDDVFGQENFLADIAWEKRYTRSNNAKRFYSLKDTVLCYRASEQLDVLREQRTEKSTENYSNPDNDPRGPWISSSYVNPLTKDQRPNLVYPIQHPHRQVEIEHPTHAWKYDRDTHAEHVREKRLYWGLDGGYEFPRLKSFLSEASEGMVPIDVWHHKSVGTTDQGGAVLKDLFGQAVFDNPKPPSLIQKAMSLARDHAQDAWVLDHFGGSGTTAHAVIDQNRMDGLRRKFLLVESGHHFDTVLVPRICKATFTPEWKNGRPARAATAEESARAPRIVKIVRLESYDDTLNNLDIKRSSQQSLLLEHAQAQGADKLREQYLLRYQLAVETRGSRSLLKMEALADPTAYTLSIRHSDSDEARDIAVDLIETFNWLLGLSVERVCAPKSFTATFKRDAEGRLRLTDGIQQETRGQWSFRVITGTMRGDRKTLIVWRNLTGDIEQDNLVLEAWFSAEGYSSKDMPFELIYVNGTNTLENLKSGRESWKVRLIEEDFRRLMFDAVEA